MTPHRIHSPEWEIQHIVERIDAGESPLALSTSERIAASIIYDHPEWRPTPYTGLTAALDRLETHYSATAVSTDIEGGHRKELVQPHSSKLDGAMCKDWSNSTGRPLQEQSIQLSCRVPPFYKLPAAF